MSSRASTDMLPLLRESSKLFASLRRFVSVLWPGQCIDCDLFKDCLSSGRKKIATGPVRNAMVIRDRSLYVVQAQCHLRCMATAMYNVYRRCAYRLLFLLSVIFS